MTKDPASIPVSMALLSLIVGIIVAIFKFLGYFATDSSAILSDALESIINIIAAAFSLYTVIQSRKDDDMDHPYGKGRLEYFSAGFEGGLIALAGVIIIYRSIPQIIYGHAIKSLDTGMILVVIASLINGILGLSLIRSGKKSNSPAIVADGWHVLSDVLTSAGMLGGLLAIYFTGMERLDPIIAALMAFWILFTGFRLITSSYNHLMDRANPETLDLVTEALKKIRKPDMIRPHRLRVRESGRKLHINIHMVVPRYLPLDKVHELEIGMTADLSVALDRPVDFMMHVDPCRPNYCSLCSVQNCPVREKDQTDFSGWTSRSLVVSFTKD